MRIVIDLQACQGAGSRHRGIGRYSRSLAEAMLRNGGAHEFWIALDSALPEAIEEIRAGFDGFLPQQRIVTWDNPFPAAEHQAPARWRGKVAEVLREDFLRGLQPDMVHVTSLFEGWVDPVATSIGRGSMPPPPTAVTLYDLIPLTMPAQYLDSALARRWYERKLEDLRRADLCLAISDFSRKQGIELLGLRPDGVVNISGACDPMFRRLPVDAARESALRARYGLSRPFTMYAGGFDPRKNVARLIRAWAAIAPGLRRQRQLAIVGTPPPTTRGELEALARSLGMEGNDVRFVGFVPDPDLVAMYNACELYVFPSLSEGFGLPALEAMACGAAVIGADASSLPEVMGYPEAMFDPLSDQAMSAKIAQALDDKAFRQRLLAHGAERVGLFSWDASARRALSAMEAWHAASADATVADAADATRMDMIGRQSQALTRAIQGGGDDRDGIVDLPRRLAAAQSLNAPSTASRPQLLVDISNLARHDARTGIQRVVRNILRELLASPPAGFEVSPLYFDDAGVCRHARAFLHRIQGGGGPARGDDVIDPRQGDIFLGLDLSAHIVPNQRALFARWRDRGVAIHFVVYDLIPLLRPDVVHSGILPLLQSWYPVIAGLADGLCCISRAVADQLLEWCDQERPPRLRPLHIGHFHLGANLDADGPAPGLQVAGARPSQATGTAPDWLRARPTLLMVGTLEPRKGHAQALDAFELLWSRGVDLNLAIVGRPGWMMEDVAARLRAHPEHGLRLHWLDDASDAHLEALYAGSAALLTASEAEGFGLPIIEAARHGLPVIARDLPVFREVAGGHAHWFSGYEGEALARALQAWLDLHRNGEAPGSADIRLLGWDESARGLLALVMEGHWDAQWMPGPRRLFPANDRRLLHQVGNCDREAWRSDGHAGFLVYGPYASLSAGRYRLDLRGTWDGLGSSWCDVVVDRGRARLANHELAGGHAVHGLLGALELVLAADCDDLEVRIWVSDQVGMCLAGIELTRLDAAA